MDAALGQNVETNIASQPAAVANKMKHANALAMSQLVVCALNQIKNETF